MHINIIQYLFIINDLTRFDCGEALNLSAKDFACRTWQVDVSEHGAYLFMVLLNGEPSQKSLVFSGTLFAKPKFLSQIKQICVQELCESVLN